MPTSAKRATAIATVALVLVGATAASLTGAAGAGGGPAKTIPTLPPDSVQDTTETGTSPSSSESTEPGTGIALRPGAGLTTFFPVVRNILGPTGDVAAKIGVLAAAPANIQSPRGAEIREFEITYFGTDGYYVATATFTSDATAEDAVTFYQATLTAAGLVPIEIVNTEEGEPTTQTLRFDSPASTYESAVVEVVVTDGDVVEIALTITDAADPEVLQAFTGWAAGLPTLDQGVPVEAALRVESDPDTLTISTRFGYEEFRPEDLAAEIRASLPNAPFALDTEADEAGSTTISMRHVVLEDVSCVIESGENYEAVLALSGTRQI